MVETRGAFPFATTGTGRSRFRSPSRRPPRRRAGRASADVRGGNRSCPRNRRSRSLICAPASACSCDRRFRSCSAGARAISNGRIHIPNRATCIDGSRALGRNSCCNPAITGSITVTGSSRIHVEGSAAVALLPMSRETVLRQREPAADCASHSKSQQKREILVELRGFEPLTSAVRLQRSPI